MPLSRPGPHRTARKRVGSSRLAFLVLGPLPSPLPHPHLQLRALYLVSEASQALQDVGAHKAVILQTVETCNQKATAFQALRGY